MCGRARRGGGGSGAVRWGGALRWDGRTGGEGRWVDVVRDDGAKAGVDLRE